ncbi:GH32 C-terminal domain-containing protein [bacterium]|nr:GH32 C-terminal domain-containing protein [bacterium]
MAKHILYNRVIKTIKMFLLGILLADIFATNLYSQIISDPVVIEDFEGSSYGNWKVEGNAFGTQPVKEEMWELVPGVLGRGYASSAGKVDTAVGTLTSPLFKIKRTNIHFLLGSDEVFFLPGSQQWGNLSVQLIVDEEVVRVSVPHEFHAMFWESWNVEEFMGKSARIRIVDNDKRKWAHLNVDHFVQSNIPSEGIKLERSISISKPVLNFPVKEGNVRCFVELFVDGKPVRSMDIALANDKIDYWVFTDVSPWLGKKMVIRTRQYFGNPRVLDKVTVENGIIDSDNLYNEPLRSQFHFSSKRGWLNDPNGIVYYDGEYHLFYQHNPFGWDHSRNDYNKSWGHAVSNDLVHWTELPDAVYPDSLGTIYSGSAVVDHFNTTGFQKGEEKPVVAIYTSAGGRNPWSKGKLFTQSIAYSIDRGRTFKKFDRNPVLKNMEYINRDPKVFWYEPDNRWVMVLHFDERAMAFFTSRDLKSWKYKSQLGVKHLVDCPELFSLPIDGNKENCKWILYGGSGYYYLGTFNGKEYKPETEEIKYSYGDCFYASQTFNNIPETDGRRIQIAWGVIPTPGMPFNQIMLFPVELTLHTTDEGLRLFAYPVKEIETIYNDKYEWTNIKLKKRENFLSGIKGAIFDIKSEFVCAKRGEFGFVINGISVVYNIDKRLLTCGESEAELNPDNGKIRLRILIDRVSIEIFANDGRIYMPIRAYPVGNKRGLNVYSKGGSTTIKSLKIYKLGSIWRRSNVSKNF